MATITVDSDNPDPTLTDGNTYLLSPDGAADNGVIRIGTAWNLSGSKDIIVDLQNCRPGSHVYLSGGTAHNSGWAEDVTYDDVWYKQIDKTITKEDSATRQDSDGTYNAHYQFALVDEQADTEDGALFVIKAEDTDSATTRAALVAGEVYIDEDFHGANQHRVYIKVAADVNPNTDMDLYLADTEQWIYSSDGTGSVTFINGVVDTNRLDMCLHVQTFECLSQNGAIEIHDDSAVEFVEVRWVNGVGLRIEGADSEVGQCRFMECGQMGIGGSNADNSLVEYCEWASTNVKEFAPGWEACNKFSSSDGLVIRYCYVHGGDEWGIWLDIDNYKCHIYRNIVIDCTSAGIHMEIGYYCSVRQNKIIMPATGDNSLYGNQYAGIFSSTSYATREFGNEIVVPDNASAVGALVTQQNRGTSVQYTPKTWQGLESKGFHNIFYIEGAGKAVHIQQDYDPGADYFDTGIYGHLWDYNTYYVESGQASANKYDWSNAVRNFSYWQGTPAFDGNGSQVEGTLPAGYDTTPTWYIDKVFNGILTGDTDVNGVIPYIERLHRSNDWVILLDTDVASGNPGDYTAFDWTITANNLDVGDYGATGIGDGRDGLNIENGAPPEHLAFYDADLKAIFDPQEALGFGWVAPDSASWSSGLNNFWLRWNGFGGNALTMSALQTNGTDQWQLGLYYHDGSTAENMTETISSESLTSGEWLNYAMQSSRHLQEHRFYRNGTQQGTTKTNDTDYDMANTSASAAAFGSNHSGADNTGTDGTLSYAGIAITNWPQRLITEAHAYDEPAYITPISDDTATEDESKSIAVVAADPNGDTVTFSAEGLPSGMSISKDDNDGATISGSPTETGTFHVYITTNDGTNDWVESFILTVAAAESPVEPPDIGGEVLLNEELEIIVGNNAPVLARGRIPK